MSTPKKTARRGLGQAAAQPATAPRVRAGARTKTSPPARAEEAPAAAPVAAAAAPAAALRTPQSDAEARPVKYTANLDHDTVDAFEALTRAARRRLGRHVDKVDIFRALILLAADDASLRDQLIASLDTHS